jgi:Holliday junction DNA helicase RuvA
MGVVSTDVSAELPDRLATLQADFEILMDEAQPDAVAVEQVFFQNNVRTAMGVGQASGLVLAMAARRGIHVVQYTPSQVKSAVTGSGTANKLQVQQMVQRQLKLRSLPQPPDAADAAALALCHLAVSPMRQSIARSTVGAFMIGSLRGKVVERNNDGTVLLEVGGVGYLVHVTPRTLAELEPTSAAFVYVHHHIREDAQTLFAFLDRDERRGFEILIATHGIGPSMAMSILATHSPRVLIDIVATNDLAALTMVPGVGRKTAERLLVELKDRLNLPLIDTLESSGTASHSAVVDVREALTGLGYSSEEIREVLREQSATDSAENMLRNALNQLGARRA